MSPKIDVLSIHEVPCDVEEARLEMDDFYRSIDLFNESAAYRKRLTPLVLIEAVVSGADARFDFGNFTQEMELAPQEHWQVAYDEAVMSPDGHAVIERGAGCADGLFEGRFCFYFHFYDRTRPMRWTYGEFTCPAPTLLPERLAKLIPYQEI